MYRCPRCLGHFASASSLRMHIHSAQYCRNLVTAEEQGMETEGVKPITYNMYNNIDPHDEQKVLEDREVIIQCYVCKDLFDDVSQFTHHRQTRCLDYRIVRIPKFLGTSTIDI